MKVRRRLMFDLERVPRPGESGYTLVALVILVAVMSIGIATVLPLWSSVIQRERERQLIFRGSQYAEAIRVFQARFGRLPVKLEELLEVEPRSIRKLWADPMTEDGRWGLLTQGGQGGTPGQGGGAAGQPGRPGLGDSGAQSGDQGAEDGAGRTFGQSGTSAGGVPTDLSGSAGGPTLSSQVGLGDGQGTKVGPIAGVFSLSEESGFRVFQGQENYNQWEFSPELFPDVVGADGTPLTPRLGTDWIGREPPEGALEGGDTPDDVFDDEDQPEDSIEVLDPGGDS